MTVNKSFIIGFDPGRDKCGLAVMDTNRHLYYHQVHITFSIISMIQELLDQFRFTLMVMGNQTTSHYWQQRLRTELSQLPPIVLVDERFTTLAARDRYWQMYPPKNWERLIPAGLRLIPRPVDDIAAIILIERYLADLPMKRI
ncbi:MAG: Holliday junction resolvase RuvX [Synechococcales cyanobacterium]